MSRFPSLRVEGGLISFDLIESIADGEAPGQKVADFGLPPKAHFLDEVADAWSAARRYWEAFSPRLQQLPPEDLGTSVTREIRSDPDLCRTPVLVITAIARRPDADLFPDGTQPAPEGFLTKPVTPDDLLATIEHCLTSDTACRLT